LNVGVNYSKIYNSILEILKRSEFTIVEDDDMVSIYHDNSVIITITINKDGILRLYLFHMTNKVLEFDYKKFLVNEYIFINRKTDIKIGIYTSTLPTGIIFSQTNTKISEYFTNKNISELLNIQLFYFKFSDIYNLLASKFKKNKNWNNNLEINQEEISGDLCCMFYFRNIKGELELGLVNYYYPENKKYNHFILDHDFELINCELIKDEKNNKYITEENCKNTYEINLNTSRILKINKSNNSGIFEFKWSEEKLYHWDKNVEQSLDNRTGAAAEIQNNSNRSTSTIRENNALVYKSKNRERKNALIFSGSVVKGIMNSVRKKLSVQTNLPYKNSQSQHQTRKIAKEASEAKAVVNAKENFNKYIQSINSLHTHLHKNLTTLPTTLPATLPTESNLNNKYQEVITKLNNKHTVSFATKYAEAKRKLDEISKILSPAKGNASILQQSNSQSLEKKKSLLNRFKGYFS